MKFWNKMKKNSKGFTLVEIIVVLVILAILAAFTIPSMLGFVGEARGKAMIAEAREVYVAAQATATEYTAKDITVSEANLKSDAVAKVDDGTTDQDTLSDPTKTMANYIGSDVPVSKSTTKPSSASDDAYWEATLTTSGQVTQIDYSRKGYTLSLIHI